jgi:hypothetical protein
MPACCRSCDQSGIMPGTSLSLSKICSKEMPHTCACVRDVTSSAPFPHGAMSRLGDAIPPRRITKPIAPPLRTRGSTSIILRTLPILVGHSFSLRPPRLALSRQTNVRGIRSSNSASSEYLILFSVPSFVGGLQWHNNHNSRAELPCPLSCDCRIPILPHIPSLTLLHRANRKATAYSCLQLMPMDSLRQSHSIMTKYRSAM